MSEESTRASRLAVDMVTVDCEEPKELAEFWRQALQTEVGMDSDDFVILRGNGTPLFVFANAEEIRRYNEGKGTSFLYSRYENPTVAAVEERLAACANILGSCHSIYRWQGKVEQVLLREAGREQRRVLVEFESTPGTIYERELEPAASRRRRARSC